MTDDPARPNAMQVLDAIRHAKTSRFDELIQIAGLNPQSDLRYGDWTGVDFSNIDLRSFDFRGADLSGARFEGALISGLILDDAKYELGSLARARDFAEFNRERSKAAPGPLRSSARSQPSITGRKTLRAIFDAAVSAAHPEILLPRHLPPPPKARIICLAAGKGAGAMVAAAEHYYLDNLGLDPTRLVGAATTRHGHGLPTRQLKVIEAGHPVPDEYGLRAAAQALELAQSATPDDLMLVLLSGGGSANWIAPAEGTSFAQKQQLTRGLLRAGAPIGEINIVRKHLSRIKGGRLARAGRRAEIITLAISDVPHDDPSAIASGPTVPDPTTLEEAREIIAKYELDVHDAVRRALADPLNESVKIDDPAFARAHFKIIGNPSGALKAAIARAQDSGYEIIYLGTEIEGEARDVAAEHARLALEVQSQGRRVAILSGGELTVTVRGHGRGGPNQEYALALVERLNHTSGISWLAADTDGADGGAGSANDPAGAVVDESTFEKMRSLNLDPADYLYDNDATGFFMATGDLLQTGPTLTNVNDVRVILVE